MLRFNALRPTYQGVFYAFDAVRCGPGKLYQNYRSGFRLVAIFAGMEKSKNIAIVAHDNRKADMLEWVEWNFSLLSKHRLICTGTTGAKVEQILERLATAKLPAPPVTKLKSGPLGGDQQLGAKIADGDIDILVFFWDPMEPHPHDVDVKALLRIAVVYNIPIACNRSSADFIISSPLIDMEYEPRLKDYSDYLDRPI